MDAKNAHSVKKEHSLHKKEPKRARPVIPVHLHPQKAAQIASFVPSVRLRQVFTARDVIHVESEKRQRLLELSLAGDATINRYMRPSICGAIVVTPVIEDTLEQIV